MCFSFYAPPVKEIWLYKIYNKYAGYQRTNYEKNFGNIQPLHLNVITHILHTVHNTFPFALTRRRWQ